MKIQQGWYLFLGVFVSRPYNISKIDFWKVIKDLIEKTIMAALNYKYHKNIVSNKTFFCI